MVKKVSAIETELLKATGTKSKVAEKRQDYLDRLLDDVGELSDDAWHALSKPAQKWANEGAKESKAEKEISDFPDLIEPESGKGKGKGRDDDAPRRGRRQAAEADDDDGDGDDADGDDGDDDGDGDDDDKAEKDADERRPSRRRAEPEKQKESRRSRAAADDDDDSRPARGAGKVAEKEKEKAPTKGTKRAATPASGDGQGVKDRIKAIMIEEPDVSLDDIMEQMGKGGSKLSRVTISNIRAEFRHSLRALKRAGKLKGIDLTY